MAINLIQGTTGAGKSYVLVNKIIREYLLNSRRQVYTNLPIEMEWFIPHLSRNVAKQSEYRSRLHFLRDTERKIMVPVFDLEGNPMLGRDGKEVLREQTFHETREFWFGVEPGSVVVVDESFDQWSKAHYRDAPETLQTFVNHHRHYKLDLFFCAQDKDDIHGYITSKVMHVYDLRNSKYEPMLPRVRVLEGIRWPIQFFMVHIVMGRTVLNRRGDLRSFTAVDHYNVFPSSRGYRNYRSFSQAGTLPGMKAAGDGVESSDTETSFKRWAALTGRLVELGFYALGGAGILWCLLAGWLWMLSGFDGPWYQAGWDKMKSLVGKGAVPAAAVTLGAAGKTNVVESTNGTAVVQQKNKATNEIRLVLVTPSAVRVSDGRVIRVGAETGFGVLSRTALNGVVVGTNQFDYAGFLLRLGEMPSQTNRGGDVGTLRSASAGRLRPGRAGS